MSEPKDRGPSARRRPTLALVASVAGVSLPTVSKVLNRRSDVSAATRARVEQAMEAVGYVPQAKVPTPGQPRSIELVFDTVANPYSSTVLAGVTTAADAEGVDVVIREFPAGSSPLATSSGWAAAAVRAQREGIIVVTSELSAEQVTAFRDAKVPLVVIDPINLPSVQVASVGSTNWAGGLAAAEHLIDLGHRRIAFIGGVPGAACERARFHGFLAALDKAGLAVEPELVSHDAFTYEVGYREGTRLLRLADRPTAVFAASDAIAQGLLEAAWETGLVVPRDLSVVGFDDTYVASMTTPPLTTIRQPLRDMGGLAFRTLMRLRAGDAPDSYHVEIATELVVRSTTAPPPA